MYEAFIKRYPRIAKAWEEIAEAGKEGPLEGHAPRLIKLAAAIGARREGAVHASVRKAVAQGISRAEIEQVIALCAGTIGLPAAVAVYSWIEESLGKA
jgi:alkylhydroperoxidase/carboxymuconolactone decarboxylase family protein YurZ